MASKEFLRKLRQKYHLGEYKKGKKTVKARPRRTRRARTRTRRVLSMVRHRRTHHRRSGLMGGGASSLIKSALVGIGGAHVAGYVPVNVPYKEEAAGALAAYMIGGKNIKSAAVGAAAVFLTKMIGGGGTAGSGNYY